MFNDVEISTQVTTPVQNSAKVDRKVDRWISDLVGSLCDPIIVMPGGWGDTLPDWIKTQITLERLIENMKGLKGEEMLGTDAEVVAYLYTASLEGPMDYDWQEIYLYMAGKVYNRHNKNTMPADLHIPEKLTEYQESHLLRFRRWLYQRRVNARQESDRAGRREQKEEAKKAKEVLQPRMFDF